MKLELRFFKPAVFIFKISMVLLSLATLVSAASYQVMTGADYFDPNYHSIENIMVDSDTSSTITFDETSNIVFASSNLATGEIKVTAVSNSGSGRAGWMDEIELSVAGLEFDSEVKINIHLIVDGNYTAPDGQASFAFYALSGLDTVANVDSI